jgi:catechol 2,3-dioxygenase-like lactoylglutathione lyase family enzyme
VTIRLSGTGADIGITARDPEAMIRFYRDFLGLPLAKVLKWPDYGSEVWFFAVGDGHVKILVFDQVPAASNPPGGNRAATGYRYLAIRVADVHEVLVGLEEAGGRVQVPIADHGSSRVVFVEDPDGNPIEFVQDLETTEEAR